MHGFRLSRCLLALIVGCTLSSCAARRHIWQGDELLDAGRYREAVAAYEEAVALTPDDDTATARLRRARGLVAQSMLAEVEEKLRAGEDVAALELAAEVRALPVDLEDVRLVRSIDRTVGRVAKRIDERASTAIERGHHIRGVDLAKRVAQIVPTDRQRRERAEQLSKLAVHHFESLAADRARAGLAGSAALQLAWLQRVGGEVDPAEVARLWRRFAAATCFNRPTIAVTAEDEAAEPLATAVEARVHHALTGLLAYCEQGGRDLTVRVELTSMTATEDTTTERAVAPLPGVQIQAFEEYEVEEPYTVEEEVTETDTRIEKRRRRDCAPRPGKPRGCVAWVEEVEVEVPVKRMRQVQKVRRVKKRRPRTGPLPADKALTYEVTTVARRLAVTAKLTFGGMAKGQHALAAAVSSEDATHPGAQGPGLVIPADPLEIETEAALREQIEADLTKKVTDSLRASIRRRGASFAARAAAAERKGRAREAEELFLAMLSLGAQDDPALDRFFQARYGASAIEVAGAMRHALGRGAPGRKQAGSGAEAAPAGQFPTRTPDVPGAAASAQRAFPTRATATTTKAEKAPPSRTPVPARADAWATEGFSTDELKALEEASLEQEGARRQKAGARVARDESREPTASATAGPQSAAPAPEPEPQAGPER